jgi:hypothetical protein
MSKPVTQAEEYIFRKIHVIRDHKVLLDADLADLYGVDTQAIERVCEEKYRSFPVRLYVCS